ncbi:MAG TPA: TIGR02281 family clan AA aspartic protease [Burkholderiales bacterium]|nr:TIGR02281 family clan AA aspartic protease [Burkholderiales bacterium]
MFSGRRECRAAVLALLCWSACAAAQGQGQGQDIDIVGLSQGRAVIVGPNGKPKVYRDGDTLPNGARLIKATPESALFEIEGKRRTLTMGSHVSTATPASGAARVTLIADERGHFVTAGTVNGASMRFLVDTGATMISMGVGDARRVGIDYLKGEQGFTRTANGVARVYKVRLDTVRVGDITLNGVDALVHETDLPWALLGMSFLNRVEMNRQGDNLTLVKRY